jgi:hypothetical protein
MLIGRKGEAMRINNKFIDEIQNISKISGGFLTIESFNKNRGSMPAWETLKKQLDGIDFNKFLEKCNVLNKEEYTKKINRTKAISNFKLLSLEHGVVSKSLYDSKKLSPSSEYISKHYGWSEIAKASNVKLANSQYLSIEDLVKDLKETIKALGYIPTSSEYKQIGAKPSQDSINTFGVSWGEAMRKAGYKPYGKVVEVKDKICVEHNCYRQFTPQNPSEVYCDGCFKAIRQRVINDLDSYDKYTLKEICKKLIYVSTSQKGFLNVFDGKVK